MATTKVLNFTEILGGALGEKDTARAKRWVEEGAPVAPLPSNLIAQDPFGLDTRVHHTTGQHRKRRRTSGEGLTMPAAPQQAANGKPSRSEGKRPPAAQQPPPPHQQQQRPQQQASAPRAPVRASSAPNPTHNPAPNTAPNLYSRAAFLSHGDAIGLTARRRARGPAEFTLPSTWQVVVPPAAAPAVGGAAAAASKVPTRSPPPRAANKQRPKQQPKQQPPKQQGQQAAQQAAQQPQQQYLSPEGLLLPSLQAVRAVAQGPVITPQQLVGWVKWAAAHPSAAQEAIGTTSGQAHMLGLCRVRVQLVEEDRQCMQQRLAAAAAAGAGGTGGADQGGTGQRAKLPRQQAPA